MKLNQRLKPRNENANPVVNLALTLVVMYVISGGLLLLLSMGLYRMDLSEAVVRIGIVAIYIAAGFSGGLFIGKKMQDKKYLWGLISGALYFLLLFLVSLILKSGMSEEFIIEPVKILTTLILCAVSAMAGGMFS